MDRGALLTAAANAASAAALGRVDADQRRLLDGKRFEVRIRFGCPVDTQPQAAAGPFQVKFDEVDRMLRVRAAPDVNLDDPLIRALGGDPVEAVEGFWLRRPWLLADGCPPAVAPKTEGQNEPENRSAAGGNEPPARRISPARGYMVAIAEFFTEADSRTARRDGRAYEAAKELAGVQRPSDAGYNLVLSGRLRQLPSGKVISCIAAKPDEPPQCVIAAQFDRVRIESPRNREILAEWSS